MSKEVLQQVLGLLTGLTEKETKTVHSKTKPRRVKLSSIQETRVRQSEYRRDMRSGELLFGEKVR